MCSLVLFLKFILRLYNQSDPFFQDRFYLGPILPGPFLPGPFLPYPDLARTALSGFITLARQSGTRCQMDLEIRTALTVLNDSWKQIFSAVTSVASKLEVFLTKTLSA